MLPVAVVVALVAVDVAAAGAVEAAPGQVMQWGAIRAHDGPRWGPDAWWAEPSAVPGLDAATQVAAGCFHGLALLEDGTVAAWGDNRRGQLGDGSKESRDAPATVQDLTGVVHVAAGCWESYAIRDDGSLWAWGGVLLMRADGTVGGSEVPTLVPDVADALAVHPGDHGMYVLLENGTLLQTPPATGGGGLEGLVIVSSGPDGCKEWENDTWQPCEERTPKPLRLEPMENLTEVVTAAHSRFARLAVVDNGTLYKLGGGPPQPVAGVDAVAVDADWDSWIVLERNGSVRAGTGRLDPMSLGAPVQGLPAIAAVSVERERFLASAEDGSLWTWGLQGTTFTESRWSLASPQQVCGISGVTSISAGQSNLAVAAAGPDETFLACPASFPAAAIGWSLLGVAVVAATVVAFRQRIERPWLPQAIAWSGAAVAFAGAAVVAAFPLDPDTLRRMLVHPDAPEAVGGLVWLAADGALLVAIIAMHKRLAALGTWRWRFLLVAAALVFGLSLCLAVVIAVQPEVLRGAVGLDWFVYRYEPWLLAAAALRILLGIALAAAALRMRPRPAAISLWILSSGMLVLGVQARLRLEGAGFPDSAVAFGLACAAAGSLLMAVRGTKRSTLPMQDHPLEPERALPPPT